MNDQNLLSKPVSGVALLGWLLIVGGFAGLLYFVAVFDTSVAVQQIDPRDFGLDALPVTQPERVNNLGLMQTRQLGVIVSVAALLLGAVLVATQQLSTRQTPVQRDLDRSYLASLDRPIIPTEADLKILLDRKRKAGELKDKA